MDQLTSRHGGIGQAALVACLVSVDRIIAVMGWDPTPWNLWKPEVGEAFP